MNILKKFAEERKYNINKLIEYGWFEEGGVICIRHSSDYIVKRKDGQPPIKPTGVKAKPYFISGESDVCVIVEGQTDAVAIKHIKENINVFAIGGTTSYKILRLLKYYYQGKKIILAYDQDQAGKDCTTNTIEFLLNLKEFKNVDIRILKWSENFKDIDEYYRQEGVINKYLDMDIFKIPKKSITYEGDFIEELKQVTDENIVLGKKIKCINPEHKDKNPSMHIYKDHAYCFTCGYSLRPKHLQKKSIKEKEEPFSKAIGFFSDYLEMAKKFIEIQPLFYDESCIWWLWDFEDTCYKIIDDVTLMNKIDDALPTFDTVKTSVKTEIIEALKRIGRKNIPKNSPVKWVQFKDKAYSLCSGELYDVKPNYFFTNPIPYEIGLTDQTPIIDKLFTEWVGEKYKTDLYEIIAYCCYRDYPIQVICCLHGTGRNGKSQYMKLLNKFLGINNICATELDRLANPNNRFESFKLYKKLMCSMGETNFGTINNTSMLKKLVGGDMIDYEVKNKSPFNGYNYAKIIIGSNSLPSSNDTSDGYMRRWNIIDFPNEFSEGKDIIASIPDQEYMNLANKVTKILPKLIQQGHFTNQGTIEERKEKYIMVSNPIPIFIERFCVVDDCNYVKYSELYTAYIHFLKENKKRKVGKREFRGALEDEGFNIDRTSKKISEDNRGYCITESSNWVTGVKLKENWKEICKICNYVSNSTQKDTWKSKLKSYANLHFYIDTTYSHLIEKNKQNEVLIQDIADRCDFDITPIIDELKQKGEYFEPKAGYISKT